MADRNRRKSSILKLPKSNARAPLQDVNTLDVKATSDEDFTSHTAHARRRVSFAGKNFVKEFCSEAEIASVYHAPEYEELLASAESSGLVTSDISNSHSSTTISENNSTFASRTHLSAYKTVNIQDDYDPCDEIMRQFQGKAATQTQTQTSKPSGKNRLSFGDIRIPQFEEENSPAPAVQGPKGFNTTSAKGKDAKKNCPKAVPGSLSTVTSQVQNVQLISQNINFVDQGHQTAIKVIKSELHRVSFHTEEASRIPPQANHFTFENIMIPTEKCLSSPSLVASAVPSLSVVDDVFESPKALLPELKSPVHLATAEEALNVSMEQFPNEGVDCEPADTTQCMNESMDFTRAVPGIIHLGSSENSIPNKQIHPEHVTASLPNSKTQIMCTSMEFMSGNIVDLQNPNVNCLVDKRENQLGNSIDAENSSMEPSRPFSSDVRESFPTTIVPEKENGLTNQTMATNISMELTRPIPSNIQVDIPTGESNVIPEIDGCIGNQTVMDTDTSMEFTKPVPSNIQVGMAADKNREVPEKINEMACQTVVSNISMEFTRPIPSNIQVDIPTGESNVIPEVDGCIGNQTVMDTDTSMEFTKPVPSNIQVGMAADKNREVPEKVNEMACQTVVSNVSMDFTRPMPSNIQVDIPTGESNVIPEIDGCIGNQTVMDTDTSMEFTKPVPSNIQVAFAPDVYTGVSKMVNKMANQTVAMNTSMDFTRPMPSNIQVGIATGENADVLEKEKRMPIQTMVANISTESTRPLHSNIQVDIPMGKSNVIPKIDGGIDNQTVMDTDTSMEFTKPVPSNIQVASAPYETTGIPVKEDNAENPTIKFKATSKGLNVQHSTTLQDLTMDWHETHDPPTERFSVQIEESFSLVADPFKSKPRIISSPPTQNGIEAVHVQSLFKTVTSEDQIGLKPLYSGVGSSIMCDTVNALPNEHHENPLSKEFTSDDPFKSTPSPILIQSIDAAPGKVSSPEADSNAVLYLSRSPNLSALKALSEGNRSQTASVETEKQILVLDVSNPFRSKSRLINTPIKGSNAVTNDEYDSAQSTIGNVLGDTGKYNCMLSDEPPPFLDVPSINMEITESVNDSGAALLHTTIRNAEITLRQMHSPDLEEMQPASDIKETSSSSTALEDMVCDSAPCVEDIVEHSKPLASNEANSYLCQQILSQENGSTSKIAEEVDKIDEKKNAKRSREPSFDCGIIDPDRSHDSIASKRLCKSMSVEHKETSNRIFGPDLSTEISDTIGINSTNENSFSSSSSFDLEEMVSNPRVWKALNVGEDLWSFRFNSHNLELKVHLKLSSTAERIVESSNGLFVSHVTDCSRPVIRWGMKILMKKLQTQEWVSLMHHSSNFLQTMKKLSEMVYENKKFLVETMTQEGLLNLEFTSDSFSAKIMSFKLDLCFEVTVKLDFLERYSPQHIQVENLNGNVREMEVKNLITGVKKDCFFIRNYIRDLKDYVKTLESFCY